MPVEDYDGTHEQYAGRVRERDCPLCCHEHEGHCTRCAELLAERDSLKAAVERWMRQYGEATEARDAAYRRGMERAAEMLSERLERVLDAAGKQRALGNAEQAHQLGRSASHLADARDAIRAETEKERTDV